MTETQRRLPEGWTAFTSVPDRGNRSYWYATSPYPVNALIAKYGSSARPLSNGLWCHLAGTAYGSSRPGRAVQEADR
jgi:hypothetical protein